MTLTLTGFCSYSVAQGILGNGLDTTQGSEADATGRAPLGMNKRSSAGLFLLSSRYQYDSLVLLTTTRTDRKALIASGSWAVSERFNLDAVLPYWTTNDTALYAGGVQLLPATTNRGAGDLTLRARYALLPEANGFALVGRAGLTTTDAKTNNLDVFAELQPLWRLSGGVVDGSVASLTAGVAHGSKTSSRQSLAASISLPAATNLSLTPALRLARYNAANGFSSYTSANLGVTAAYWLSRDSYLTATLSATRISAPTFAGIAVQQPARQTDVSVGVVRVF